MKPLARSRNIPALKHYRKWVLEKAKGFANGLGLNSRRRFMNQVLLVALNMDVTTLQMAGAFSAFGNNGYYTEPHSVKEINFVMGQKLI